MFIQHFLSFSHLSDHSHNIMNIWNDKVVLDKTNSPQVSLRKEASLLLAFVRQLILKRGKYSDKPTQMVKYLYSLFKICETSSAYIFVDLWFLGID